MDGIAGTEAVSICLAGAVLYGVSGSGGSEWVLLLLAAVAGFLLWNSPWVRILIGDAGSGFVGIVLGILSIHTAWVAPELFWFFGQTVGLLVQC
ncbi:MAG: hypothetical protein ABW185_23545 [Sedimenticola sp.]